MRQQLGENYQRVMGKLHKEGGLLRQALRREETDDADTLDECIMSMAGKAADIVLNVREAKKAVYNSNYPEDWDEMPCGERSYTCIDCKDYCKQVYKGESGKLWQNGKCEAGYDLVEEPVEYDDCPPESTEY